MTASLRLAQVAFDQRYLWESLAASEGVCGIHKAFGTAAPAITRSVSACLTLRGKAQMQVGHKREARRSLDASRDLLQSALLTGTEEHVGVLIGLGDLAGLEDNLEEATRFYSEARRLSQGEPRRKSDWIDILNGLGSTFRKKGLVGKARGLQLEALALVETSKLPPIFEIRTLNNLALVAIETRDLEQAKLFLAKALDISTRAGLGPHAQILLYHNLAVVAWFLTDYEQAEVYFSKSLDLSAEDFPEMLAVGEFENGLGMSLLQQFEFGRAEAHLLKALEFKRSHLVKGLSLANTLHNLGLLYKVIEKPDRSCRFFEEALDIQSRLAPSSLGEAAMTQEVASCRKLQGLDAAAAELYLKALDIVDVQLLELEASREAEANYRHSARLLYSNAIENELSLNRPWSALLVSERYRAQVLTRSLLVRGRLLQQDVAENRAQAVDALSNRRRQILEKLGRLSVPADNREAVDLKLELLDVRRKIDNYWQDYAAESRYLLGRDKAALPSRSQIMERLHSGTAVLVFFVGAVDTIVFVLDGNLTVFRAEIGEKEMKTAVESFWDSISRCRHRMTSCLKGGQYSDAQYKLYDLLIKPARERLDQADRLMLVTDGPLNLLPFEALKVKGQDGGESFLAEQIPVFYGFSILTQPKRMGLAGSSMAESCRVSAFGNPDLSKHIETAGTSRGGKDWPLLPYSEQEAKEVASLFGDSSFYHGPRATEDALLEELERSRILHLATHALFDSENPMNSGLLLSAKPSGSGSDGFLQAWEIATAMDFRSVNLAVLSGCETAQGESFMGEGLWGLTHALLSAGVPSVVASLWPVDDYGTVKLMRRFYEGIAEGESVLDALHEAKVGMIELGADSSEEKPSPGSSYNSPYFWAGFRLFGHWGRACQGSGAALSPPPQAESAH